jgi:hypothetical protein
LENSAVTESPNRQRFQRIRQWVGLHPSFTLLVIVCISLLPILLHGVPVDGDDSGIHLRWQRVYAGEIAAGNFFPRWLHQLNEGFGSPAFFMYPPLAHFVSALTFPLFPSEDAATYRLAAGVFVASWIGAKGAYHWFRAIDICPRSALIGAMCYTLVPYHLFIDTYLRVAVAELWAFAWAPWTFVAMNLLRSRPILGFLGFTLSASALLLSHAPSSVFLFPTYFIYSIVLATTTKKWKILWLTAAASGLSILISGAYLIPALTQQGLVKSDALFSGFFEIKHWLFFSRNRWVSVNREILLMTVAVLQSAAAIFLGWRALKSPQGKLERSFIWLGIGGTVMVFFLMTQLSLPLWELASIARKIQFPWRLLTVQSLFLALLTALYSNTCKPGHRPAETRKNSFLIPIMIAVFLLFNIGLYLSTKNAKSYNQHSTSEYEPVEYQLGKKDALRHVFPGDSRIAILSGSGNIRVQEWQPRHIVLRVSALTPLHAALHQFAYSGWEFRIQGTGATMRADVLESDAPLVSVHLPAGLYTVELLMPRTSAEKYGFAASLAGVSTLMLFLAFALIRQARVRDRFGIDR